MAHDVNQSEKEVAAQVRSALVDRISSERYDLWIPEDTRWEWMDDALTLTFASKFNCQLAKKMLSSEVAQSVRKIVGRDAEVRFEASSLEQTAPRLERAASQRPRTRSLEALRGDAVAGDSQRSARSQGPGPAASRHQGSSGQEHGAGIVPAAERPAKVWEQFIHGTSNQLAWTTANLIVSEPGRLNPVLFHGPTGCGKSLLVQGIAEQLRGARRLRRVVHMTSEQFTNDFTEGLRGGGLPMFRRRYRDVEALILDDVQFFFGKRSTLGELKHTIDNLIRLGKQVILTADRSLDELQLLGSELTGRLRGGMIAPIFPLDAPLRAQVLSRQLQVAGIELDQSVIDELAARICGDGRVLLGIVNRLTAVATLKAGKLSWDDCWNSVIDLVQATQPVIRLGDIERAVCNMFGLESESLQSPSKTRNVSQPRMLAMFLARKYTPAAYKEIGNYFGRRRHSTVISAEKTVTGWLNDKTNMRLGRGLTVRDAIRQVESQLQVG